MIMRALRVVRQLASRVKGRETIQRELSSVEPRERKMFSLSSFFNYLLAFPGSRRVIGGNVTTHFGESASESAVAREKREQAES